MHQSLGLLGSFEKTQRGRDVLSTLKKILVEAKKRQGGYYLDGLSLVVYV
jgi:hypothetical protein